MNRILLVTLAVVLASPLAAAEGGGVGLGVILGEPTGLSAKFWLGATMAFDVAAAWSVYRYTALHIHADVLYHNFDLLKVSPGALAGYVGVGGRLKLAGQHEDDKDIRIGVRVPFGVEYLFETLPVGLFLEVAPVLDLVPGTGFSINGAIGGRFYLR